MAMFVYGKWMEASTLASCSVSSRVRLGVEKGKRIRNGVYN